MKSAVAATAALLLFAASGALAQDTNSLSDAETAGRALAQRILQQWPAENTTNTGILQTRESSGKRTNLPLTCIVTVNGPISWTSRYEVKSGSNATDTASILLVTHSLTEANRYALYSGGDTTRDLLASSTAADRLAMPFAGSDFSVGDLGLEFFHWPQQKVLKKEVRRSCGCTVLESTNPDTASTNGYSRVVAWIDSDSLGIVEAYAYDRQGKGLKYFYPKDLKKVNGQYQVQTMIMENDQADTRTRLEFDLKK
jgi:hypothetical protein